MKKTITTICLAAMIGTNSVCMASAAAEPTQDSIKDRVLQVLNAEKEKYESENPDAKGNNGYTQFIANLNSIETTAPAQNEVTPTAAQQPPTTQTPVNSAAAALAKKGQQQTATKAPEATVTEVKDQKKSSGGIFGFFSRIFSGVGKAISNLFTPGKGKSNAEALAQKAKEQTKDATAKLPQTAEQMKTLSAVPGVPMDVITKVKNTSLQASKDPNKAVAPIENGLTDKEVIGATNMPSITANNQLVLASSNQVSNEATTKNAAVVRSPLVWYMSYP